MSSPTLAEWKSSAKCESFSLTYRNNKQMKKAWTLNAGSFCLVMHQKLDNLSLEDRTVDAYWKARILEIRRPKIQKKEQSLHYLLVEWFYTKGDIDAVNPNISKELKRYLESSAQQELYASNHREIILSSEIACRLHGYEIIILQDDLLDHPPVVTYFTRFFWNYNDLCLQGAASQCSLPTCNALWNPDLEEQRFCWQCQNWFHTDCLISEIMIDQKQQLAEHIRDFPDIPRSILEVAHQPTARGGNLHFISGNIRLVNMGRQLLSKEKRDDILDMPDPWMEMNIAENKEDEDTLWREYLKYENNIDEKKEDTEQLVVKDQVLYACPGCDSSL